LTFDIVDRQATYALSQRFGLDANPWRMLPRLITSYDYLKQSDVFEQFRAACHLPVGSPHLPWDLLIVDEVHNLTPAPFGEESDAARMLRLLAPWFEHKLFLTATPHNRHTRSFTGLLEALDPVRFTRTSEPLTTSERTRVEEVVVRRLKSEINAVTNPRIPSKIRGWKSMPWRVATMKESGHNSSRSASLPLLEPEALCLKTLTCPALPMNGHASWSSSC